MSVWLISLRIIPSSPMHVVESGKIFLLLMSEQCSIVYMYHILFNYSSPDGHVSWLLRIVQ